MSFKWTEEEMQRVAAAMFRMMTSGKHAITDHWPAFKMAQSFVNPIYKYSVNNPNDRLMKELKARVSNLFNEYKDNVAVKAETVLNPEEAKAKARELLEKITHLDAGRKDFLATQAIGRGIRQANMISAARKAAEAAFKQRVTTLLTGNTVELLDHEVDIVITTNCPRKFVIVDLETGQQYSSLGVPVSGFSDTVVNVKRGQKIVKPVRRLTIPKPKKEKA
jgi:hypothetical protein